MGEKTFVFFVAQHRSVATRSFAEWRVLCRVLRRSVKETQPAMVSASGHGRSFIPAVRVAGDLVMSDLSTRPVLYFSFCFANRA